MRHLLKPRFFSEKKNKTQVHLNRIPGLEFWFVMWVVVWTTLGLIGLVGTFLNISAPFFFYLTLSACVVSSSLFVSKFRSLYPGFDGWQAVALIFIIADCLITLFGKTAIVGDSYFHMGRITYMLEYGLSNTEPVHHQFLESRYHFNVVYYFNVLLGYVFPNFMRHEIWVSTGGIYRIGLWLGLYYAMSRVFLKTYEVCISVCTVILLYGYSFVWLSYPNNAIFMWLIPISALIVFEPNLRPIESRFLLIALCGLVGLTQTIHSMWVFLFLLTAITVRFYFFNSKPSINAIISLALLVLAPLYSKLNSPYVHPDVVTWAKPKFEVFWQKLYLMADVDLGFNILELILLGMFVFGLKDILRKRLANVGVVFLVGIGFYYFIANSPILFGLANQVVPDWLVTRASFIGQVTKMFAVGGGVVFAANFAADFMGLDKLKLARALLVLLVVAYPAPIKRMNLRSHYDRDLAVAAELADVLREVPPGSLVLSDKDYDSSIIALRPVRLVTARIHTLSPNYDYRPWDEIYRKLCSAEAGKQELLENGVDFYLDVGSSGCRLNTQGLRLIKETKGYRLFSV